MKCNDVRTIDLICNNNVSVVNERVKRQKTKVVGMDKELKMLINSLRRYKKPNAIIIGSAGVGKTALVEKLAIAINKNKVPKCLKDKVIVELNINSLVAGTRYRGDFEQKLDDVLDNVKNNDEVILFIDEFHTSVKAGDSNESGLSMGNVLKPYLARGEIKVIGATTEDEYKKYVAKDKAFKRRFRILRLKEPSLKQTMNILKGVKGDYEKHYKCKITDEDIFLICIKSVLFRSGCLPDKAFDEMEEWMIKRQDEK